MKKILSLLLAVILVFSMTGCGKSEDARIVEDLISAIGTVELENEKPITDAENAYKSLTDEQKEEVENYQVLTDARKDFDKLKEEKKIEDAKGAAAAVDELIKNIGTVTADSETAINTAKSEYDNLTSEEKSYVKKYADLEAAETAFNKLKVDPVIALIDAIGTVTIDSGDAINKAQTAYDALDSDLKSLVTNAQTLTDATKALDDLRIAEANKKLSALRLQEDEVRGYKFYYPRVFPFYDSFGYWGADVRCFALPYLSVSGNNVYLRLVCDYTSSDWVFFEKIIFSVDGKNYTKYFDYFDVTRDNEYGDVWEYVDIECSESDIEMLEAIAASTKTIVRFEGDDYYYDFTVSGSDKTAIKEMVDIYKALS